jgi:hypothetical protein
MAIIKTPSRTYQLGETLPPLGMPVVNWPWGNTPSLQGWAQQHLALPLGTIIIDTIDGHPVVAQIQTHEGYGAHPDWPNKPHKGTSVFVPAAPKEGGGALIAIKDPPAGWGESATMGAEGFSVDAVEHFVHAKEEEARGIASKVPKGLTTVGGAAIGLAIGGPPGALLLGAVGLGLDLWSHLLGEDKPAAGHGTFHVSAWAKTQDPTKDKAKDLGTVTDATDREDAAKKAAERFLKSKLARVYAGHFVTESGIHYQVT